MERQSSTGLVVAYTGAQSMALNNARITLLRAAEIVPSENASFEIQAAGRVALEIFNCVETAKMKKSEWEELVIYIAQLFGPIMDMLEHQMANDTDRHLRQDLDRLRQDMERILCIIRATASDEVDIAKCNEIVNNSLRAFQMYTSIALRMEIFDLSKRMALLQTPIPQIDARDSTFNIFSGDQHNTKNHFPVKVPNSPQTPSECMTPPPPQLVPPEIFYGRDETVDQLVEVLDCPERIRIAILGSGGIGKTSLALHLMNHHEIVARFAQRRHFVACDAITSSEALATLLLSVVGKSPISGEHSATTLQRILNTLPPMLLLLDNFETPWDPEASRSSVEDLLATIGLGRSISLVMTMRGSVPPSAITWTHTKSIMPLSPEAAMQTYCAINPSTSDLDESQLATLDTLLKELDCVPLAIRLLATIGRGFTPTYLLRQWKEERTSLLHIRNHRLDSIAVSISLSLSQLSITENPEAIQLLGVLALLPDGLRNWTSRISDIATKFERVHHLVRLLQHTSLIVISGERLTILSPIRHYILAKHPSETCYVEDLETYYWKVIRTYGTRRIGLEFPEAIEILEPEIGNIGGLIKNAIQDHPSQAVIDATINLSWYFSRTVPSVELLTQVKDLAKCAGDPSTEARWYHAAAINLHVQGRYTEAYRCGEEAQNRFAVIGNELGAAQCSRTLGGILLIQSKYDEAVDVLKKARDIFTQLGDVLGTAQCCQSLGEILRARSNNDEASAILQEALQQFINIDDIIGTSQCAKSLGRILYMQGKEVEAAAMLTEARDQSIAIGDVVGAAQCSRSLGAIFSGTEKYAEASEILNQAREQFIKIGDKLGAARSLQGLGSNLRFEKKYAEAHDLLTKARMEFLEIGDSTGINQCDNTLVQVDISLAATTS